MLNEFLKEAVVQIAGKPAENVVEMLNTKKYVNEFLIAKKIDLTINQTRNILYKLSDNGLVSSIRKKDKKKGWYTYFWRIETLKALEFLKKILLKRIEQINNQVHSRETKQFYICERCNIELNEENALLYDFSCNECGDVFKIKDNLKLLKELKKNLNKFQDRLNLINKEIEKEQVKVEKEMFKESKKIAKEKADKRKATRKKNLDNKKETQVKQKIVKKKSPKKKTATKKKGAKKKKMPKKKK